ncbi:MAG: ABC transporter permease [Chloroflexi bacterium]|nr:ABC transporter permease [Chloroflexota bacterium]
MWRFLRQWPVLPVAILASLVIGGVLAPVLSPHEPTYPDLLARGTPPMWMEGGTSDFPLGTDNIGRDIYSRLLYGARISLLVVSIATVSGLVVGTTLGLLAGYMGRHIDEIIMRIVDIWYSVPFIMVALILVVVFGKSTTMMMVLLALLAWTAYVRNVRAEVLTLKELDYVSIARVSGASTARILIRHILPGVVNTIIVIATLRVGQLILAESVLSFLGAGIPPPQPAWGVMVSDGRNFLATLWWISFIPGFAIFLVVMSFNFLGDWLRDKLDPRLRQLDR